MTVATSYAIRKSTLRAAEVAIRMTCRECPCCHMFVREFELLDPHWDGVDEWPRRFCRYREPAPHLLKRVWRGTDWRWEEIT